MMDHNVTSPPQNLTENTISSCPVCPWWFKDIIEASRDYFAPALACFGIASNLMTILVLLRVNKKSSSENLLLIIALADLALPVMHLARHVYVSAIDDDLASSFRILVFYLWHVFSAISALLTLVLATRRLIAIEHPHKYQSFCNRQLTNRILMIVCVFSVVAVLPMYLFLANHPVPNDRNRANRTLQNENRVNRTLIDENRTNRTLQNDEDHAFGCKPNRKREIIYSAITITSVLGDNVLLKLSYWLYVFGFQILCPLVLAVLSVRFKMSLNKKIDSSSSAAAKTKLILIVSLLTLIRDLPLGVLSSAFIFARLPQSCLTTVRLLTRELIILMSALNFFVLYYTNEKFRQALPWCTPLPQNEVSREVEMNETNTDSDNETPQV